MNNDRVEAIATCIALPGFSDLGCLVTPIFLLMHPFLYDFLYLMKKGRKSINYSVTLPSRPRHPQFFCRLQTNVFDAASLFQTNQVVH